MRPDRPVAENEFRQDVDRRWLSASAFRSAVHVENHSHRSPIACRLLTCRAARPACSNRSIGRELPATVDQPGDEAWLTRSPDGQVILFGRHQPDYSNHHIYLTRLVDGVWTEPVEAPFTGGVSATAPHFAPDGRSVLFIASWTPERQDRDGDGDVWRVSWDGTSWGVPEILPAPINSPAAEIDVVEANNGVIYFTSMRDGRRRPAAGAQRAEQPQSAPIPTCIGDARWRRRLSRRTNHRAQHRAHEVDALRNAR